MATLATLIDSAPRDNTLRNAIAAAYWAGQEEARGRIARRLHEAADAVPRGRYRRVAEEAVETLLHCAGDPRDDAAEILAWIYDD